MISTAMKTTLAFYKKQRENSNSYVRKAENNKNYNNYNNYNDYNDYNSNNNNNLDVGLAIVVTTVTEKTYMKEQR